MTAPTASFGVALVTAIGTLLQGAPWWAAITIFCVIGVAGTALAVWLYPWWTRRRATAQADAAVITAEGEARAELAKQAVLAEARARDVRLRHAGEALP